MQSFLRPQMLFDQFPRRLEHAAVVVALAFFEHQERVLIDLALTFRSHLMNCALHLIIDFDGTGSCRPFRLSTIRPQVLFHPPR